ncbi:hypothetical protein B9479_004631 [Cryptococcus floricola]|uniref:GH18 domain-containing protein n=1 Tax=Cryptococcus floricola TaxID=2591691 RepID=A0A5D3AV12_9TREE|nr:hypothetical protein B9479_004631 [Cryptococcus floricola]
MYYATAILSLLALVEAAGPHHGSNRLHRRHHARAALSGGSVAPPPLPVNLHVEAPAKRDDDSCTHGDWNCVGSDLQRCVWGDWTSIRNCTGDNIVCSTQDNAIGCVWTWNVDSSATPTSGAESATASLATVTGSLEYNATSALSASEASATASQVANSTLTGAIAAASPTTTGYASNVTSTNSTTTDEDDEDCDEDEEEDEDEEGEDEDCGDDDEDYTSTSSVVAASSSVASQSSASSDIGNAAAYATAQASSSSVDPTVSSSSATASASSSSQDDGDNESDDDEDSDYDEDDDEDDDSDDDDDEDDDEDEDDEDEDDEDCDDEDSSSSASVSASASVSSSFDSSVPTITDSASTANATETSAIGDGLYAPGQDSTSSSASETAWDTASSSSSKTHWWNSWNTKSSSASEASATASGSESASSTDSWSSDPTASSSSSDADSWNWWGSSSDSASTASASQSSTGATASASSSASSNTSSSNTSSTTWSAPHYVIYADESLSKMPSASELSSYNRFILAFWQYDGGAVDDVQTWADFDESYRNEVITEYHNAGIALMISAFGSEDTPTTSDADAKTVAQDLAAFVKQYNLDGVDIDYEDMSAMNSAQGAAWIVTLQTELRSLLPSPYIISHAPVAPWFTSASDYSDGAYVTVHQSVGDTIDFYSVQYYNQGDDQYVSCDTLITNSGSEWPSTSVFELNSYTGIPLEKIVIGKPLDSSAADNGFMSAADLAVCVAEAIAKGWNGGVMFWEWTSQAPSVMATVRG